MLKNKVQSKKKIGIIHFIFILSKTCRNINHIVYVNSNNEQQKNPTSFKNSINLKTLETGSSLSQVAQLNIN